MLAGFVNLAHLYIHCIFDVALSSRHAHAEAQSLVPFGRNFVYIKAITHSVMRIFCSLFNYLTCNFERSSFLSFSSCMLSCHSLLFAACSEMTATGVQKTQLDQILLNGNNVAMVRVRLNCGPTWSHCVLLQFVPGGDGPAV